MNEELVEEMSIDQDLKDVQNTLGDQKKILDDHTEKIQIHSEEIQTLIVDSEVLKERWNNITVQLTRIENSSLSTNNALLASNNTVLQTLQKVVDSNTTTNTNNAQVTTAKTNSRKEISIKILGIILVLVLGYFAMKGIVINTPTF